MISGFKSLAIARRFFWLPNNSKVKVVILQHQEAKGERRAVVRDNKAKSAASVGQMETAMILVGTKGLPRKMDGNVC